MNGLPFPDLSVQVTRRRARCVLSPDAAFSRHGPTLAKCLRHYVDLWFGPEFFNILDSAPLYQSEPELLAWPGGDNAAIADLPEVLRDWLRLRDEAGRTLWWVGDALRESSIPDDVHETVVPRFEAASRALDQCLPTALDATGPLIAAMRDAAALCAVLRPGWILAVATQGEPPLLCRHLREWGFSCEHLALTDSLVAVERAGLQCLLVEAGLAPLVWDGLRLVAVHLKLPHIGRLDDGAYFDQDAEPTLLSAMEGRALGLNPWEDAKCFWYDVTGPAS